jgi:hypothetical protein
MLVVRRFYPTSQLLVAVATPLVGSLGTRGTFGNVSLELIIEVFVLRVILIISTFTFKKPLHARRKSKTVILIQIC